MNKRTEIVFKLNWNVPSLLAEIIQSALFCEHNASDQSIKIAFDVIEV